MSDAEAVFQFINSLPPMPKRVKKKGPIQYLTGSDFPRCELPPKVDPEPQMPPRFIVIKVYPDADDEA